MYTIRGGTLGKVLNLTIRGRLPVSREVVTANHERNKARSLPGLKHGSGLGRHLAVVGGGPSIRDHLEELQYWDGDVWAINGAWGWCEDHGVRAAFIAIDPHPIVKNWPKSSDGSRPKKAILASCVDPEVFDALSDREVTILCLGEDGLKGGSSTASLTPHLAAICGYSSITLYGCESSYDMGKTHAYQHEARDEELIIEANGLDHLTAPDFLMQAKELATFAYRGVKDGYMPPHWLTEKSGGLVRAWIADLKAGKTPWVKWISDGLVKGLHTYEPAEEETPPFSIAAE